ncbi:transcriptional regulator, Crp/Fnr family [Thermanaeromonas toyohensis ToBE]|uniref:Transcriptional regulator, Crp/Fnr family n=1 Tax=Thermanaeromonas toyohensis ToBE TaxID=698762 RepID=A0A1W1W2N7_9FIRM|nr:Crp/Fnr family transcriptional regulator [Thermanaeromonas toyohensis]SMB99875.1 transcriptional regulator, Crp/Fnr family [Thermanaeromonas toyohensis ToBE]
MPIAKVTDGRESSGVAMALNSIAQLPIQVTLEEWEKQTFRSSGLTIIYPKGYIIFAAGDVADKVYLINRGRVKIYRLTLEGRRVTVSIRETGELFGLAETLCGTDRVCFAEALEEVNVSVLKKEVFENLLLTYPLLAIKIAKILGSRLREAESLIHHLMYCQIPQRLALLLLKLAERCGQKTKNGILLNFRLTHEEIACMIGTSRQTVSSVLNNFKKAKIIAIDEEGLHLLAPEKLAQLLT